MLCYDMLCYIVSLSKCLIIVIIVVIIIIIMSMAPIPVESPLELAVVGMGDRFVSTQVAVCRRDVQNVVSVHSGCICARPRLSVL